MLTKQEIERLFVEMDIQSVGDRARFLEWYKCETIKPEPKGPVFIRITTTTEDIMDKSEYGKLERNP